MKSTLFKMTILAGILMSLAASAEDGASIYRFKQMTCLGSVVPGQGYTDAVGYIGLRIVYSPQTITDILGQTVQRDLAWTDRTGSTLDEASRSLHESNGSDKVSSPLRFENVNGKVFVYFKNFGRKDLDLVLLASNTLGQDHLSGTYTTDGTRFKYTVNCTANR